MTAAIGGAFVLIAVYQLVTGSMTFHVGRRRPTVSVSARGTRIFAVGLASFGVLMLLMFWNPSQLEGATRWVVVIGLLVLSFGFWWIAVRIWIRERQRH